jgi:hypothetical protein
VKPQRFVDDSGQVVTRYPAGSKRPDVMILNDSDYKAGILEGGAKVDLKGKIDAVADLKTGVEGIDPKWRSEVSQRVGLSEANVHEVRNGGNFQESYERGLRRAGGFAGRALAVADVLGMATSVHHAAQQAADEQNTRNPYVGETGSGVQYSMMFDRLYFKMLPIAPMINQRIYFWNGPAAGQEVPVSRERWNELNKQLESEGRTMNSSRSNVN